MKFLIASAAAALVASSVGASAADLAKKAPVAVDYVKVCDAYGAGFFYIPGSETCLKIGGYLRAQVVAGDDDLGNFGDGRTDANYATLGRLQLQVDARSQTEFGVLRSFGAVNMSYYGNSGHTFAVDQAYIQWAGITAGKAQSFFDFFTGYAPAEYYGEVAHDDKVNLFAYTFGFANGVSLTLSLEDSKSAGREGTDFYGGNKAPDVVAALKIEQGWGSAQVMAVAHNAYGGSTTATSYSTVATATTGFPFFIPTAWSTTATTTTTVYDVDKWGYAIGAGATIKLPMFGADDEFGLQAVYADGALRYLTLGDLGGYDFADSSGDLSKGWAVFAGLKHGFTPKLVGALQGGFVSFDSYLANADFDRWDATASLTWTPVTNLEVTAFAEYRKYDYSDATVADTDGWAFGLRMQRNF
jgi:hypothetical protein